MDIKIIILAVVLGALLCIAVISIAVAIVMDVKIWEETKKIADLLDEGTEKIMRRD